MCSECCRNPENTEQNPKWQRWIKPEWDILGWCKIWLKRKDIEE
jgi:hypothetical protein